MIRTKGKRRKIRFNSIFYCGSVSQYARETEQLNKINRNEGRLKLFSLDPERQVKTKHIIYLFHYRFLFFDVFPPSCLIPRGWTSRASSQTWSRSRSASVGASWSAATTSPSACRAALTSGPTASSPMYAISFIFFTLKYPHHFSPFTYTTLLLKHFPYEKKDFFKNPLINLAFATCSLSTQPSSLHSTTDWTQGAHSALLP